jgi:3,4-dihydroxy 2-butanone 4-phosphate synthase/GTP cyclohydrolase II
MALSTIQDIIEDIRQGKMVILMDDEDRENEGDLIVAAEKITADMINFMATEARGLICLPLSAERCDHLRLSPMTTHNGASHGTSFTVSIEAAEGVSTGISAADRARTIQAAVNADAKPDDLVQPGHIFPLRAQPGGVLSRAGHTEAGCDLTRLAGLEPAAVIVEIMNPDGSMARRPELEAFAERHQLKVGTIADLIQYRMETEHTVDVVEHSPVRTVYGTFELWRFSDSISQSEHWALTMGEIDEQPVLVRVTSMDWVRDLLQAVKPGGNSWSVPEALARIAAEGKGTLVLLNNAQDQPSDQITRFLETDTPGSTKRKHSGSYMVVGTGSQILRHLGVKQMRLLSSPVKYSALSGFDLEVVEFVPYTSG